MSKHLNRLLLVLCFAAVTLVTLLANTDTSMATATQFNSPLPDPPMADFYSYPEIPAANYDVYFDSHAYDPAGIGIAEWYWDLGDGTTATDPYVIHQYAADGDYLVYHHVKTYDGRTSSIEKTVTVRTIDVSITQFGRPRQATVGQTKRLVLKIANKSYPTNVNVDLYKSVSGGFEHIGYARQFVDAKHRGHTIKFLFNYTFTKEDAELGKVIFKAIAWPENAFDVFPADNEFITFATTVKSWRGGGRSGDELTPDEAMIDEVGAAALDDYSDYVTDTTSNQALDFLETGDGTFDGAVDEAVVDEEIYVAEEELQYRQYLPSIVMD